MRYFRAAGRVRRVAAALAVFLGLAGAGSLRADKPTGEPLVLSTIETEQGVPLAIVSPDGKTVSCVTVRLHWNPQTQVGPNDDPASFTLDIPPDSPGAAIFTAQLWTASLASAMAWQQPWQGARWKVLDTPATDGTGIDAALAVGMISTSARRPYPKDALVIGSLRPDGSLGAVARLEERLDAASAAGIARVIIPSIQRFDTDSDGNVINVVKRAADLHLECVPVDNLAQATEAVMNDPLPEVTLDATTPHYDNGVAGYIDDFAQHEQFEVKSDLAFAPSEADLSRYPAHLAALWQSVYADNNAAQQAYRAGQVYVAYRLFARASGRMHGLNALLAQNGGLFDVKNALADAEDLRRQLHDLITPPSIDKDDLASGLLVAEMCDWAYDLTAELEGAELVTKQTYSQRTDASAAERDRAREAITLANEEAKYLLKEADFFTGLLPHVAANPVPVDENAAHLLPQLIPAQLAAAEIFTEGIRPRAGELREGLLFDPRLAAYIDVLRETQTAWNARQRRKEFENTPVAAPADESTKLNAVSTSNVAFDPGNTYAPPHTEVAPSSPAKKLSDTAACLVWANNDCEIAALDEKYLRLGGTIDPATHEWHLKDRARLDALLQMAETGARQGIAFAEKADVDTAVLDMIYEKAAQLRIQGDDVSVLDALRNFWRCALLGNICWQLAHAQKAQAVDLNADNNAKKDGGAGTDQAKDQGATGTPKPGAQPSTAPTPTAAAASTNAPAATPAVASTNAAPVPPAPAAASTEVHAAENAGTPAAVAAQAANPATNAPPVPDLPRALPVTNADVTAVPPVAPPATNDIDTANAPRALPVTDDTAQANAATNAPPVAPPADAAATGEAPAGPDMNNIPVAPVARTEDYSGAGTNAAPATNAPPATPPGAGTSMP
jgi:hypothetical protein